MSLVYKEMKTNYVVAQNSFVVEFCIFYRTFWANGRQMLVYQTCQYYSTKRFPLVLLLEFQSLALVPVLFHMPAS